MEYSNKALEINPNFVTSLFAKGKLIIMEKAKYCIMKGNIMKP
jgi:hypothetical protein